MGRVLCAAMVLIIAACAPAQDVATIEPVATPQIVAPAEVPTTQVVELVATVAPTPVVISTPPPTATVDESPTASPTPDLPTPDVTATPLPVAPDSSPAQPSPAPTAALPSNDSQEVLVANGAEVYLLTCARCHGANGGGEIYGGLIGVGRNYTAASMFDELTNGHPVTFGFSNELSVDEIASVVAYVKAAFP